MFGINLTKINPMKVLTGVGKFVDESFLTNEEIQNSIVSHFKTSLQESTPRALTRRYIALAFVLVFLFLILLAVGVYPWYPLYSQFIFELIKDQLFYVVITIVVFYFGGYYGSKLIKDKKEK
jgi:hypothetical protein